MFKNLLYIIAILLISGQLNAQELLCTVTVNADKIPGSNKQKFTTLQNDLSEFVNQKHWTNFNYKLQEKIHCNLTITILQESGDDFKGNIQIQSSRPVFNATYLSPVFNFKDDDFSFQYTEYQPLLFNQNTYESNLISVVSFYVYTLIGLDADTFSLYGGTPYFNKAQNILVQAQQSGYKGWNQNDSSKSRFILIDNILSPTYRLFRDALYEYHIKGLDLLSTDKKNAKKNIAGAIQKLKKIFNTRPNAFLLRVFMDAKSDEIVNIFSDGPYFDVTNLKNDLLKISSVNASKWRKIK
jgi:hypothetical protein